MSLLALQRSFRADLRGRPSDLEVRLDESWNLGQRVYRNAYRLRLRDCLRETYERTWAWLGDERFDAATEIHAERCEPRSWTLGDYGEGFARSLGVAHPDAPEAVDLAALEWAMRRAFDGPAAFVLTPETCSTIDWETAALRFAPTLRVIRVTTNCGALWSALAEGRGPPAIEWLAAPAAVCVWRKELSPTFRTIDGLELAMLRMALAGLRFGEICRLARHYSGARDHVAEAGAVFGRWLNDGLVADPAADQLSVTCNQHVEPDELVRASQAKSTLMEK